MMKTKLLKLVVLSSLCALQAEALAASCTYKIENEWGTGFVANITIANTSNQAIDGWNVNWKYSDGTTLVSSWNVDVSGSSPYSASPLDWNKKIAPQSTFSFGLQGNKPVEGVAADIVEVTGDVCNGDVVVDTNVAPVADFVSEVAELSVAFDASTSYDVDADTLTYTWDFADGTTGKGVAPTHVYATPGNYDVKLTVSDGQLTSTMTQTVDLTVAGENEAPVAHATHVLDGLSLTVDAATSIDPNGDQLTYSWDFGDSIVGNGSTAFHTYALEGEYTVTLTVSDDEFSDTTSFVVSAVAPVVDENETEGHVTNPFIGATSYINQDYATLIDSSIAQETDAELIRKMESLKNVPTAVWLDRIDAIKGGDVNGGRLSLEQHLLAALEQQQGTTPITVSLVIYDLPDRDCAALASNGTLSAANGGLAIYKEDYIDVIADMLAEPRFSSLRIIASIEPDSLPNLVTNSGLAACAAVAQSGVYVDGITYALRRFSEMDNVYTYLDIAHSGWLGWDNNLRKAVTLYTDLVKNVANGDMSVVDGFVTNVSNSTPIKEVFLPDPDFDFDNDYMGIKSSDFYEWNPIFDEKTFAETLHSTFVANGFPEDIAIIVDTSRNGWGGADRPESANLNAATEDQYVVDSKIDRRAHRGLWCNVTGTGIGERPQTLPLGTDSAIEAYVWIKPPGESDGTSDTSQTTPDAEGKSSDPMCDPTFTTSGGVLTNAMDNAPSAGSWFHDQFKALVENAYPEL